jgi:hypothetical protein
VLSNPRGEESHSQRIARRVVDEIIAGEALRVAA